MAFADDDRFSCPPDVLSRVLDGEAVLLNLDSGNYHGLNEVASHVWKRITKGQPSLAELRDSVTTAFEVTDDMAQNDLQELLTSLEERHLITVKRATR